MKVNEEYTHREMRLIEERDRALVERDSARTRLSQVEAERDALRLAIWAWRFYEHDEHGHIGDANCSADSCFAAKDACAALAKIATTEAE